MKTTKIISNLTIAIVTILVIFFVLSCKSTPPEQTENALVAAEPEPAPAPPPDPNTLPPEQAALDRLEAAMVRAQEARIESLAVQAQIFFPDEWNAAETSNEAGKSANTDTLGEVNAAIAQFTSAAEGWESLTGQSGPLFAEAVENARAALEAAAERAQQSRKAAEDNRGPSYFPNEWKAAEALRQQGDDAGKETPEELNAAAALYTSAADGYDDIAGKSAARFAQEQKDEAQKAQAAAQAALTSAQSALTAATQRAERSRTAAMDVSGQTYFANDWKAAEGKLQSARSAKKATLDEVKAATTLFTGTADAYDAITSKSRPLFTKDKDAASKDLQTAIARAQKSRAAVTTAKAETVFPNEWKNAETRNQSAANAKRATIAEMKAAAPLYNTAADAYDDIARKNTIRTTAADAVKKAKERSEKSIAYATSAGLTLEGKNAE